MPAPDDRTPVLLLHGFWHGGWCWTEVLARLTAAGVRALAGDLLAAQVKQLGGAPVTVVAHSMGGAVLTRAGQLAPELITHAVYLAAYMPASGVPPAAYVRMPENEGSRVGALRVGDARDRGAAAGHCVAGPGVPGGRARGVALSLPDVGSERAD